MSDLIALKRRYWFWQQKRMLRDDVGYTLAAAGLHDFIRPWAIKWINPQFASIPSSWQLAPNHLR